MEQGEQHYLIFSFADRPGCRVGNRGGGQKELGAVQTPAGSAGWRLCNSDCVGAEQEAGGSRQGNPHEAC